MFRVYVCFCVVLGCFRVKNVRSEIKEDLRNEDQDLGSNYEHFGVKKEKFDQVKAVWGTIRSPNGTPYLVETHLKAKTPGGRSGHRMDCVRGTEPYGAPNGVGSGHRTSRHQIWAILIPFQPHLPITLNTSSFPLKRLFSQIIPSSTWWAIH